VRTPEDRSGEGLFPDGAEAVASPPAAAGPDAPLAERMRPASLSDVEGPASVVGPDGFLRRAIAEDRVPSLILWGPPGVGKTTLARLIAVQTRSRFIAHSAVSTGVREMRDVLEDARRLRERAGRRTTLFLDEIHRFNRAQQDVFLSFVERGDVVLVGATTENPSFELNGALLSRCEVVVLEPLDADAIRRILRRAVADGTRGLRPQVRLPEDAEDFIARIASGDARRALNLLEAAAEDAGARSEGEIRLERLREIVRRRVLLYDKAGEEHYNLISALHKSMRESDPDAAVYWLYRMLEGGEEPLYIARRVVRFAAEDIGLADPAALSIALDAKEAYDFLGSPEGELAIAEAVLYCAVAPKSNAVYAAEKAVRRDIAAHPAEPVPMSIRNAVTPLMKQVGYGAGYVYAHDEPEGVGGITCLPEALRNRRYYRPRNAGEEREISRRLEEFLRLRREKAEEPEK
jgi:putative ATPase